MAVLDFGKLTDYTSQLARIRELAKQLRRLRPRISTRWEEPADWLIKDANMHGQPARTLTITLTPTGCQWASAGGCTMCGEYEGSTKGDQIPSEFHVAQFAAAVGTFAAQYSPDWIRIYQEGNYANTHEFPKSAGLTILRLASLIRGVRRITVESMAKYITVDAVREMSAAVSADVELEIGMGFEGEDDVVRNVCVNKGESLADFQRAVDLLQANRIRSLAYVLLKPPFLTEEEAILEAIATVNMASDIGFDAVSVEPVSIHGYTLVHALSIAGLYRPPWLWSVIDVAQRVRHISDLRIGGIGFYPRPLNVAHNRHSDGQADCNGTFWAALKDYGRLRDVGRLASLTCDCRNDWQAERTRSEIPLPARIDSYLSKVNVTDYAAAMVANPPVRLSVVRQAMAPAGGSQYPQEEDSGPSASIT